MEMKSTGASGEGNSNKDAPDVIHRDWVRISMLIDE